MSVLGRGEDVNGGAGADSISVVGDYNTISGGSGSDTIGAVGRGDDVSGGDGADSITVSGDYSSVSGGSGHDTITAFGKGDEVLAGTDGAGGAATVEFGGSTYATFDGGSDVYHDTIVGFDQAAGDRVHLSTESVSTALAHSHLVNSGQDTEIKLQDGSTILLKGITHLDPSFFS
jgi:hypothetical protein